MGRPFDVLVLVVNGILCVFRFWLVGCHFRVFCCVCRFGGVALCCVDCVACCGSLHLNLVGLGDLGAGFVGVGLVWFGFVRW